MVFFSTLPSMAVKTSLVSLAFLSRIASAAEPKPEAWCFLSAQLALTFISFGGTPSLLEDGYYAYNCQNEFLVKSTYLAVKKYCPEEEWEAGLEYTAEECMEGLYPLLEPHTTDTIASGDLSGAPTVAAGDFTIYNSSVVPDEALFLPAQQTIVDVQTENIHHLWYSKAMFIFWGIVVSLGTLTHLASWIRSRNTVAPVLSEEDRRVPTVQKGTFASLWTKLQRHLLLPATFSKKCNEPVFGVSVPPRSETLILFAYLVINIVLCAVSYRAFDGNIYWPLKKQQTWRYFADRTGYLSYANLTIFWAFGIRNNILIWMTGWNYPTFSRFHRWIAIISTLQAILHSIGYTAFTFVTPGEYGGFTAYAASFLEEYWYCGVIATCAMSLIPPFSLMYLRIRFYDFFLITHIVLSIVVLVTLFYHTKIFNGEFDGFLWPCVAFWAFDRVCRIGRVLYHWLTSTSLKAPMEYSAEGNLIRVDVTRVFERINPAGGAYYFLYSPLSLFGWENHPFTLVRWKEPIIPPSPTSPPGSSTFSNDKQVQTALLPDDLDSTNTRYSFMIRPYKGYTSKLARKVAHSAPKTFLYEGPYGHAPNLKKYTDILFLVGGSGISVAISCIYQALEQNPDVRINLVWASRTSQLIDGVLARELKCAVESGRVHVNAHITRSRDASMKSENLTESLSAHRPSVDVVIRDAVHESTGALAVVACGPASMMDDARVAFIKELKGSKGEMELFLEAFNWNLSITNELTSPQGNVESEKVKSADHYPIHSKPVASETQVWLSSSHKSSALTSLPPHNPRTTTTPAMSSEATAVAELTQNMILEMVPNSKRPESPLGDMHAHSSPETQTDQGHLRDFDPMSDLSTGFQVDTNSHEEDYAAYLNAQLASHLQKHRELMEEREVLRKQIWEGRNRAILLYNTGRALRKTLRETTTSLTDQAMANIQTLLEQYKITQTEEIVQAVQETFRQFCVRLLEENKKYFDQIALLFPEDVNKTVEEAFKNMSGIDKTERVNLLCELFKFHEDTWTAASSTAPIPTASFPTHDPNDTADYSPIMVLADGTKISPLSPDQTEKLLESPTESQVKSPSTSLNETFGVETLSLNRN